MWQEFKSFLIKQNALALAIAVVMGTALNGVVTAFVEGFIMPLVAAVTPDPSNWENWKPQVGPVTFGAGQVLSAILNFIIVGFVAWRLSKIFIRPAPAPVTPATRSCPQCYMTDVDPRASRCPHCTSELAPVAA